MAEEAELESILKELFPAENLAELGPGPRPSALGMEKVDELLGKALVGMKLSDTAGRLVRALVLLWNDHLDEAHVIAQAIENADGSYVHGIVHRREPDYGNAKYWFRRVGRHPVFGRLAEAVSMMPGAKADPGAKALVRGGDWDSFGFIDLCEEAEGKPARDARVQFLREAQAAEFRILAEHLMEL